MVLLWVTLEENVFHLFIETSQYFLADKNTYVILCEFQKNIYYY